MNQRWAKDVCLVLSLLITTSYVQADEPTEAERLADRAVRAVSRIQGLSASFTVSFLPTPDQPATETAEPKRTIFYKFNRWKVDRKLGRFMFDVDEFRMEAKEINYETNIYTWNGQIFSGYNSSQATVVIDGKPMSLAHFKSPATLLGDGILGGDETLADILRISTEKSLVTSATLEARFSWELDASHEPIYAIRVTLAPEFGDLPNRIEVADTRTGCKVIEVNTTQFVRVDGGNWIPARGNVTCFRCVPMTGELPERGQVFDDDTLALSNSLSESARPQLQLRGSKQASSTAKPLFRSEPMGIGKMWIDVDHKTCRDNPDFADSEFVLDDMKHIEVLDMQRSER